MDVDVDVDVDGGKGQDFGIEETLKKYRTNNINFMFHELSGNNDSVFGLFGNKMGKE
jgi:hypothetical protein